MRWDASTYLQFGDERTRPAADLIARIPVPAPRTIVDLGCGPGNSTAQLAARWPDAAITGVDSSDGMIATARRSDVRATFVEGDFETWSPAVAPALVVANAAFQWSRRPLAVTRRWFDRLDAGGVLAVQVPQNFDAPSHRTIRAVADRPRWRDALAGARPYDDSFPDAADFARALGDAAVRDIWTTTYLHILTGDDPVFRWLSGTGLRPYLDRLDDAARAAFTEDMRSALRVAYPPEPDGTTLFPFKRLFVVAQRG